MPHVFRRLFGTRALPSPARVQSLQATLYSGDETLEVVGESHYQEALWTIVGGRRPSHVRYETYAVLLPNPDNEHDHNAIEVRIDGQLVGYLSRDDAARYHSGLLELMSSSANHLVALHAMIVGGGPRPDGLGYLGVFLDHDPADFGLSPHHSSNGGFHTGGFRTGLSAAITTHLADDRDDLSWSNQLPDDDGSAARQLRALLEDARDPIDRHYLFCELERRLYRSRNTIASALDEFDAVCVQHDTEMNAIRPALLDEFGVVPVIEMYRQATIRCAKAKQWQAARQWAERGISVYGEQASRPEVVEDLHKRIAHANAKSAAAEQPRPRTQPGATVPTTNDKPVVLDTLTCAACGSRFLRVRTRGRKPRLCPTCRVTPGSP